MIENTTMFRQIISDIRWKYLLLSVVLGFCILLLLGSLIASYKVHSFAQAFDSGKILFSKYISVQEAGNKYLNSYYWVPLHLLSMITAQISSCLFLMKHAKGVELINGLAHGLFLAVFVYQLNFLYSSIGIIISVFVSFKRKGTEIT